MNAQSLAAVAFGARESDSPQHAAVDGGAGTSAVSTLTKATAKDHFAKIREAVFREERRAVLRGLRTKYATAKWYSGVTGKSELLTSVAQYVEAEKRRVFSENYTPEYVVLPGSIAGTRGDRGASRFKKADDSDKKPPLVDGAPEWWVIPPAVRKAADNFDALHNKRLNTATKLHGMHKVETERLRVRAALRTQTKSVASTRYVEPTVLKAIIKYEVGKKRGEIDRTKRCTSAKHWHRRPAPAPVLG